MTSLDSYTNYIEKEGPRFAVFTAEWCGPCKSLKPLLKTISEDNEWFDYILVDVDEDKDIMKEYLGKVRAVPTFACISKDLSIDGILTGAQPMSKIVSFIEEKRLSNAG